MTFRRYLTVLLVIILFFAAAAAGIFTAQFLTASFETTPNSANTVIDERETGLFAPKTPYNVLLMGTDAEGGLTDVMMVYHVDPQLGKVKLLSIPRDTHIIYNGRTEKINAAHSYGRMQKTEGGGDRGDEYAIRAVKELTGMPIHHYVCINFAAFRQVIDAIGGFDYDVPQRMKYDDPWQDLHIDLQKGFQHLDGDKAEQLVRFRRYPNGDIDRVAVQQDVLKALIKQKANPTTLSKVGEIYRIVQENIDTDMSISQAIGIAKNIYDATNNGNEEDEDSSGVETFTVPGGFRDISGLSYWEPNLAETKKLVADEFGYGDTLNSSNAKVSTNK
ncbi:MAG: LCP family protein [Oscillospiraceae bacterium]|nr:LCP family protein [Oscillospiraceae bacterium]